MKILSSIKASSDIIIYIFLIGIATNMITEKFFPIMAILLVPGLISSIIYLLQHIFKSKER